MNQVILVIAILASVGCYTLAECPTKVSLEENIHSCMEKLLPGSSHDKELGKEIMETIETLNKDDPKDMEKIEPLKINVSMKLLAMRVLLCFADEFLKTNPEITTVVFDCVVNAKGEPPGKKEKKEDHEDKKLEREIHDCVKGKIIQMCPSKSGKSKRSLVELLFN